MAIRIPRPHSDEYHPRFNEEIASVPDTNDFGELLRQQARDTAGFVAQQFGEQGASVRV
jgi:hypothetical protein